MKMAYPSIGSTVILAHAGAGGRRYRLIRNILAVAALVLLSALVSTDAVESATPSSADDKTLKGKLAVVTEDDFESGKSKTYYYLKTGKDRRVRLQFSKEKPRAASGAKIKVKGRLKDNVLSVNSVEVKNSGRGEERGVPTLGAQKVAIIMFRLQDQPDIELWPQSEVRARIFTNDDSVNAYYREDSGEQLWLTGYLRDDGDVFGPYEIGYDSGSCDANGWKTAARNAAINDPLLDPEERYGKRNYDYVVYIFKDGGCNWAGLGGGNSVLIDGLREELAAHELGHAFGVGHANGYKCVDQNGQQVTLSDDCEMLKRADPFDIEGNLGNRYHHHNRHKWRMGFLPEENTLTVTGPGTYTLLPSWPLEDGGTQMLRIPRPNRDYGEDYFLEYRRPNGIFDNFNPWDPVVNGISIRIGTTVGNAATYLLDAHPGADSVPSHHRLTDSALREGATYTDLDAGISVTAESVSPLGGASLEIAAGCDYLELDYDPDSLAPREGDPFESPAPSIGGADINDVSFTVASALPAGLDIDGSTGVITGTPTTPLGTTSYSVVMNDLNSCFAAKELAIEVRSAGKTSDPTDLLDEINVRIDGASENNQTGKAVSDAGDVNDDGFDDVIVGAPRADNNGREDSGSAYVVFGQAGERVVDLENLGDGGYRIDGAAEKDKAGTSVAGLGDVNDDGFDDVIVGAPKAGRNDRQGSGSAYIVYGKVSSAPVDLSSLGVEAGFRIDGANTNAQTGISASGAGDVNDDGFDDVIVGAPKNRYGSGYPGSAFVVFGQADATTVDLRYLGEGEGFTIDGADIGDLAGEAVAGVGDINHDGFDDVIIGAPKTDHNGRTDSGSAYVVYGSDNPPLSIDLGELGENGFRIDGAAEKDEAGSSVAGVGDINDDDYDDVIIGASEADNNYLVASGSAYVIYGRDSSEQSEQVDLAELGDLGLRIDGAASGDRAGSSVSGAGDINADGLDDVVVGAPEANNNTRRDSGSSYVVYGRESNETISLAALGAGGYRIDGAEGGHLESGYQVDEWITGDSLGVSVSGAGDVDGDGNLDVIAGAPYADNNGKDSGSAFIVYGYEYMSVTYKPDSLVAMGGEPIEPMRPTVVGAEPGDVSFSVDPSLPDGLTLDPETGDISGIPAAGQHETTYTIFVTNQTNGYVVATDIAIRVVTRPKDCSSLAVTYSTDSLVATVGSAIESLQPEVAGIDPWDVSFAVDPSLPDGLTLDPITGIIFGTPTTWHFETTHTVTMSHYLIPGCTAATEIVIEVLPDCSLLAVEYSPDSLVAEAGRLITPLEPEIDGVDPENVSFSVTPSLPPGLALYPVNGVISGRPVKGHPTTTYTVTMTHLVNGCASTAEITIEIVPEQVPGGPVDLRVGADIRIDGEASNDSLGTSVKDAGDVNGDGADDVIVAASYTDNNDRTDSGSVYVVFGGDPETDNPGDRRDGFRIDGANAGDSIGTSNFSGAIDGAGDVNGDGYDDVIVGVYSADNNNRPYSGSVYIVYGKGSMETVDLAELGKGGFRVDGAGEGDVTGFAVAGVGDINRDGLDEVAVGSPGADNAAGGVYVIYGRSSNENIDLAELGDGGFRIRSSDETGFSIGGSISDAGDVNGDRRPDLVVGTAGGDDDTGAGAAFVVFGSDSNAPVDLARLGDSGFRIDGASPEENILGWRVSEAGDANGDGLDDLTLSAAMFAYTPDTEAPLYVIYGKSSSETVNLAQLGSGGFRIDGAISYLSNLPSVSGAGDVNGDGVADVVVGVPYSEAAFVVYGCRAGNAVDLNDLASGDGFRISGIAQGDATGTSVSAAGDLNSDGGQDVIIGAPFASNNDLAGSGSAYVVYGQAPSEVPPDIGLPHLWPGVGGGSCGGDGYGDTP